MNRPENSRTIPLDTVEPYYCTEDGRIFRGDKELKGWQHQQYNPGKGYGRKYYLRYALMVNAARPGKPAAYKRKQYYGHRLVAMCFHSLLDKPGMIVRHLTENTMNNHYLAILPGTHEENQTIDRIEQGTYMNRGGG